MRKRGLNGARRRTRIGRRIFRNAYSSIRGRSVRSRRRRR